MTGLGLEQPPETSRKVEILVTGGAQDGARPISTMRTAHKPKLSDLRESGEIEQEADVVWLLHRETYYHQDDRRWIVENPQKVNAGELIVAKNRNGQTGMVNLHWAGEWGRFTCVARETIGVF